MTARPRRRSRKGQTVGKLDDHRAGHRRRRMCRWSRRSRWRGSSPIARVAVGRGLSHLGQALRRGRFITFEGGEGAGKSTQARLLAEALRAAGIDVADDARARRRAGRRGNPAVAADRRGRALGRRDRGAADGGGAPQPSGRDHLAGAGARANGWCATASPIRPRPIRAMAAACRATRLAELHRLIAGDFAPDLTLILDLPVEIGLARAAARAGDGDPLRAHGRGFPRARAPGLPGHRAARAAALRRDRRRRRRSPRSQRAIRRRCASAWASPSPKTASA